MLWRIAVLLVSAHFALSYETTHRPMLDQAAYAAGTTQLPYQARVLMAWVLRNTVHLQPVLAVSHHAPGYLQDPYQLVLTVTAAVCMAIALVATRASILQLTGEARTARWQSMLVAGMAYFNLVMPYGLTYTLPYDMPSLALFTVALWSVIARRLWIFYPALALATLNRETSLFLVLFFAAWSWPQSVTSAGRRWRWMGMHVAAQIALWLAIKAWLHSMFAGNATQSHVAGLFLITWKQNLHFLLNPGQWPLLASICGCAWLPVFLCRRYLSNPHLRLATAVVVPCWFIAMLLVGVIVEIRIFNELASILSLAAAVEIDTWQKSCREKPGLSLATS